MKAKVDKIIGDKIFMETGGCVYLPEKEESFSDPIVEGQTYIFNLDTLKYELDKESEEK